MDIIENHVLLDPAKDNTFSGYFIAAVKIVLFYFYAKKCRGTFRFYLIFAPPPTRWGEMLLATRLEGIAGNLITEARSRARGGHPHHTKTEGSHHPQSYQSGEIKTTKPPSAVKSSLSIETTRFDTEASGRGRSFNMFPVEVNLPACVSACTRIH